MYDEHETPFMRDILDALAAGELSPQQAEAALRGYVTGDGGMFDADRLSRRGIPEAIIAEGKRTDEVVELASISLETTDLALVTRASDTVRSSLEEALGTEVDHVEVSDRSRYVLLRRDDPPSLEARVAIVSAGTADAPVAGEAAAVLRTIGVAVDRIDDVGVAAIDRLFDRLDRIRDADVVIAVAGREGSLPTVLAGLVSAPVIAVPTPTGYGAGGTGEAALLGALQSCTVLSTVNIGAGFVAGAQAALIAQQLDRARRS